MKVQLLKTEGARDGEKEREREKTKNEHTTNTHLFTRNSQSRYLRRQNLTQFTPKLKHYLNHKHQPTRTHILNVFNSHFYEQLCCVTHPPRTSSRLACGYVRQRIINPRIRPYFTTISHFPIAPTTENTG